MQSPHTVTTEYAISLGTAKNVFSSINYMLSLIIRPEIEKDKEQIREVTFAAFKPMPYADGNEHELVDQLRDANALKVSLVAELDDRIIGHIAFSPATATDGSVGWYALGPVSVLPAFQRSGVGSALVHKGLQEIGELGACGCILVGDPNYYTRFGFENAPELAPLNEPAEYFMIKMIDGAKPDVPIHFHKVFYEAA